MSKLEQNENLIRVGWTRLTYTMFWYFKKFALKERVSLN